MAPDIRPVACLLTLTLTLTVSASSAPETLRLAQDSVRRSYGSDAERDRVVELPGYGKPDFGLFSG